MDILKKENVVLNAQVSDKTEAIRKSGQVLVDQGYVAPAYIDGMLGREETMSTYIGNGVAIPHGELEDREYIYSTGLSVLQVRDGIEWEPGEVARLVVGIAATEDEHLDILSNLAEVLEDSEGADELATTDDAMVIIERLTRAAEEE
jgi:mannitol/fructose-specific phosphotransferase system IIA component